jgi:hypothetical protein
MPTFLARQRSIAFPPTNQWNRVSALFVFVILESIVVVRTVLVECQHHVQLIVLLTLFFMPRRSYESP